MRGPRLIRIAPRVVQPPLSRYEASMSTLYYHWTEAQAAVIQELMEREKNAEKRDRFRAVVRMARDGLSLASAAEGAGVSSRTLHRFIEQESALPKPFRHPSPTAIIKDGDVETAREFLARKYGLVSELRPLMKAARVAYFDQKHDGAACRAVFALMRQGEDNAQVLLDELGRRISINMLHNHYIAQLCDLLVRYMIGWIELDSVLYNAAAYDAYDWHRDIELRDDLSVRPWADYPRALEYLADSTTDFEKSAKTAANAVSSERILANSMSRPNTAPQGAFVTTIMWLLKGTRRPPVDAGGLAILCCLCCIEEDLGRTKKGLGDTKEEFGSRPSRLVEQFSALMKDAELRLSSGGLPIRPETVFVARLCRFYKTSVGKPHRAVAGLLNPKARAQAACDAGDQLKDKEAVP